MYVGRDSAYLRTQRKRAISRKERIIKAKFQMTSDEYINSQQKGYVSGKLDKGKVHCSCSMCNYEKHNDIEKHTVEAKMKSMGQEIDEYI